MATTYKVLGQANPAASTDTTLITAANPSQVIVSTIVVCNQAASSATYRIAVRPDAAAIATQHYLVYDATIAANSTATYTIGITIDSLDVITVRASTTTLSFSAFGSVIA